MADNKATDRDAPVTLLRGARSPSLTAPGTETASPAISSTDILSIKISSSKRKIVTSQTLTKAKKVKYEQRECDICAEVKDNVARNFPSLSVCDHGATVCLSCYRQQFTMRITDDFVTGWTSSNCPLCDKSVSATRARKMMTQTASNILNKAIAKHRKVSDPNWLACPGCDHGQRHNLTKQPFVNCGKCRARICCTHKTLWHYGKTCHEYHESTKTSEVRDKVEEQSADEIKRITKPCPFCKVRIQKQGGCGDMKCQNCREKWSWNEVCFDGKQIGTEAEIAGR